LSARQCYPGTYLALGQLTKSGQYAVSVRLSDANVPPTSLVLTVYPSYAVGTNSKVEAYQSGQGLLPVSIATAGTEHVFMIKSFDAFFNPVETLPTGLGFLVNPILLGWSNPVATLHTARNITVGTQIPLRRSN